MIKNLLNNLIDKPNLIWDKCWYSSSQFKDKINFYSNIVRGDKKIIAINVSKSIDFIAIVFACLIEKQCFVPLDYFQPMDRKKQIFEEIKANIIFSEKNEQIFVDLYGKEIGEEFKEAGYIIYTSGSTGKPKGVVMPENGILKIIMKQIEVFSITEKTKFCWLLNTGFDASLSDILTSILGNGSLLIPNFKMTNIKSLYSFFNEFSISHSDIPPSLLSILAKEKLNSLTHIICGGELIKKNTLLDWSQNKKIICAYGPTETTICSSCVHVISDYIVEGEIGLPFDFFDYKILLNNQIYELKNNISGELLIYGDDLISLGYVNNEFLNKSKFIYINEKKYFKTGDLISFQDKKVIFKGRIDRQIKINGCLVCPEEIEFTVLSIVGIENCYITYDEKLNLFYEGKIKEDDVRKILNKKLPKYLIPNKIVKKDFLNRNINFKIDKK